MREILTSVFEGVVILAFFAVLMLWWVLLEPQPRVTSSTVIAAGVEP